MLENQLLMIKSNHETVIKKYEEESYRQSKAYQEEIDRLNTLLEQKINQAKVYENQISHLNGIIHGKDQETNTLRMLVDKQKSAITNEDYAENQNKQMVASLRRERDDFKNKFQRMQEEYESRMEEYEVDIRKKNDQIQRYHYLVKEK